MLLPAPYRCDTPGCGATRKDVNHWFAVHQTAPIEIYKWDECPPQVLSLAQHFCGVGCLMKHVSSLVSQDTATVNRESTLELKPPLARDGSVTLVG